MQKLSNETMILLKAYEMALMDLEATLGEGRREILTTLPNQERSYVDQHMQHMLQNIQKQKAWCRRIGQ